MPQPVNQILVLITGKVLAIVVGKILERDGLSVLKFAFKVLLLPGKNIKQGRHRHGISAQDSHFVAFVQAQKNILEQILAHIVFGTQFLNIQNHITGFALGAESDVGIFSAGCLNFLEVEFFEGFFTAGCLF